MELAGSLWSPSRRPGDSPAAAVRPARPDGKPSAHVGFVLSALHLGALWALAFVLPLFDLLGDNAEFFVARGSTRLDILLLAFGYGLVPPVAAAALIWVLMRLRPALGRGVHVALVGLLAAAIVLPPLGRALSGSAVAVAAAVALGAGFAVAYMRTAGVKLFLTVLSPAPLIAISLFLVFSPVSKLMMPREPSASPAGPARSSTPIVHVILDELPVTTLSDGGRFDARLFPNLARFARGATWYRNATSVADMTTGAVPAQLTGTRPRPGELPIAQDHPGSLFTLFAHSHDLVVEEPITDVCPDRLCAEGEPPAAERLKALAQDLAIVARHLLLPADLRRELPAIDQGWGGFGVKDDEEEASAAEHVGPDGKPRIGAPLKQSKPVLGWAEITAAIDRAFARPPLVFMHSTLPHASWRFLPDGHRYTLHRERYPGGSRAWTRRQWVVDRSFQRHVLQTQFTDVLVGRLFDRLRARGLYDDAVIVVTADHGASFGAGQLRRRPTKDNLADIAGVPFIVKWPGQRQGMVDDRAVRTIDVLPTIAKAAGVRVPWKIDGMPADERRGAGATPIGVLRSKLDTPTTLPLRDIIRQRRARNAYEARLLRHGVYGIGPRPDLIGTPVGSIPARPTRAHATVDEPGAFRAVSLESRVLPAFVSGAVTGVAADAVLVVAVNGRIEQSTRVEPVAGRFEYEALVPPGSLRPGSNAISVLQVLPGDRLLRIGGTRG
jgi:hypothetical protein